MCDVWLARDQHGLVVLKRLGASVAGSASLRDRFRDEAEILGQLTDHPNIVPFRKLAEFDGVLVQIFEYEEASAFEELITFRPQLPLPAAVYAVSCIASALAHAHAKGVVHRDIAPANILISNAGDVLLIDFNLAVAPKRLASTHSNAPAQGRPGYMHPEQANTPRNQPRPPWDVFALGVVLYECLAGRAPFSASPAYIGVQKKKDLQPLHQLRPDVPPEVDELVADMLGIQGRRIPPASLVRDRLKQLPVPSSREGPLQLSGLLAEIHEDGDGAVRASLKRRRRRLLTVIVILELLLLLLLLL